MRQHYKAIILILFVAIISYGQMVKMNFWQDDNAVVFKFTHIYEEAGYLGTGVLGTGPYRYTLTPYLPIFKLFGYNPLPFFTLALFSYLLSVVAIYFLFLTFFENKTKAIVAGLLYATGYIASDGFIRMFNSVLTSLSVILVSATLGFYYKYYKYKKIHWYLLSFIFFFLTIEIGFIRAHFIAPVVIIFELLFILSPKLLKPIKNKFSIVASILRTSPFLYIFYRYYFANMDARSTGQVFVLIKAILKGEFHQTFSFFASFGNVILSNETSPKLFNLFQLVFNSPLTEKKAIIIITVGIAIISLWLTINKLISRKIGILFTLFIGIALFVAKDIFSFPGLIGGTNEKIALYVGITFFLSSFMFFIILPSKKYTIFFLLWIALNLIGYAAYIPIYAYPSDNRYLLFSFIPLIGIITIWTYDLFSNKKIKYLSWAPLFLVFLWGTNNLYSALSWQNKVIEHRANPSKRFFKQLIEYVPVFQKNSVFYFYIPDKPFARAHFDAGFGVAQMPEETAIAWRYGLDRYDFKIANNFGDLIDIISENKLLIDSVYTFVADSDNLVNTTDETRELLTKGSYAQQFVNEFSENMNAIRVFPENISTLTPVTLTVSLKGVSLQATQTIFPYIQKGVKGSLQNQDDRDHYLSFRQWREYFYKTATVTATSDWKTYKADLLLDRDIETYWEADRIEWDSHNEGFTVDLGKPIQVGGIFYRNGPDSLIPLDFEVLTSLDGKSFTQSKETNGDLSQKHEIQKVTFDSVEARFVKILYHSTIYDDSPGVSEIEIIPTEFSDIDPLVAQNFFRTPFANVETPIQWSSLLNSFRNDGLIRISWRTDASNKMITNVGSTLPIKYNGIYQIIEIKIPAGGTSLEEVEILPITIPGTLDVYQIIYKNKKLN